MEKKLKVSIIAGIILIILLIILVRVTLFSPKEEEKYTGVEDKGVKLIVYGWKDGVMVGAVSEIKEGELASILEFNPPSAQFDLDAISIQHTITSPSALSEVSVNISDLQGSFTTDNARGDLPINGDTRYEDAILGLNQTFVLIPGGFITEMGNPISITDLEDDCNEAPYCEFKLQVIASFQDVDPDTGAEITTNISLNESYGTIIIKVTSPVCSDGTPYGQCSLTAPGGQFCDGLNGLISCASPTGCTPINYASASCPCDSGYYETNGDAVCSAPMCDGGLAAGLCLGINALICDPDCVTEDCGATIQDCYYCGQTGQEQGTPLGWLDLISNAAECPPAYNGDPASSCHEIQHKCKYRGKRGVINVVVAGS